ncbi:helix-turn-helix transcriptional regulator [Anaerohalosphaera lusitana]|uniref:helix-turn-helix transcriptional regulator n=1 Tax=Anaerohalosphaera lusitana TaxID=1936003 RepID=UPI001475C259|nr:AraC family transcriptional regulator [Anaerohalosphaera lusitana]
MRANVQSLPRDIVAQSRYFFYETESTTRQPLEIVCGGYERCGPAFFIDRTDYPFHVIKFTITGKGMFMINGSHHKLEGGVITSFSPGDRHTYRSDPHNPMEHIFVTFTGTRANELLRSSTLSKTKIMQISEPASTLQMLHQILQAGLEKNEYSQQICCNYLEILLLKQASALANTNSPHSLAFDTYRKCKKYIDDNFSAIRTAQQVANSCDVNVRYMSRLFKKHNYISPYEYLTRLKMNKAINLLLHSQMPVSQIGLEVGFEDQFHFSRVFKKYQGLSPQNYRQRHMS